MGTDRVSRKLAAKASIRQNQVPPVTTVMLIYILLTTVVNNLLSLFYAQPFTPEAPDLSGIYDYDVMANVYESYYESIFQNIASTFGMVCIFVAILTTLYCIVMQYGLFRYTMKIARSQPGETRDLFHGFSMVGKIILLELVMGVFIWLWSLLFLIPGIIAAYRYRMAPYILLEHPEMSVFEAIRQSKQMMNGWKGDLFVQDLSFLGWLFLGMLLGYVGVSVGSAIGGFFGVSILAQLISTLVGVAFELPLMRWLIAYMGVTEVNFYDVVSGQMGYHGGVNGGRPNRPGGQGGYPPPYDGTSGGWQNDHQEPKDDPWN